MVQQNQLGSVSVSATSTIPELQQSKTAVLNTLASRHSRRSYEYAIDRFIAWYCNFEPRLEFSRSVVVRTAHSWNAAPCQRLRSTYIFPRFGGWPMNLPRAVG